MNKPTSPHPLATLGASTLTALLLSAASGHGQVLFQDTFDRANDPDLNASTDGKSGTLGALTWATVVSPASSVVDILNNSMRINSGDSNGNNGGIAYISDHNFADAEIKTAGTFTVTLDITAQSSGGNGRFAGFRIGQSLADISGETNAAIGGNAADVQVYLDAVGSSRGIRVYEGGSDLSYVYSNASTPVGVLSATFSFADMDSGTTLNYEVFLDGVSRYVGSTTWSGTDENYISVQSNSTNNTLFDTFTVEIPVVDVTGPIITSTNPVDDAPAVPIASDLVAGFDEAIVLGATGTVTICNLTNPGDVVIDTSGSDPDGTLTVSGFELTIDPAVDLTPGDDYVIEITGDAIEDLEGNQFLGLMETDTPNWSFTADGTAPLLSATNPVDDATNVPTVANLVATFDEDVVLGATGSVTIRNLTTPGDVIIDVSGSDPDGTLAVSGTDLTIDPAVNLNIGDEYVIEITGDAIVDVSGNLFGGLLETDVPNWSFTTDGTAPVNSSFGPMTGATDVPVRDFLTLTLDEDAQVGTGNITIHLASDDSVVETIDVTGGLVTIDGATVSIDPSVDLANGTDYYINIEAGAFEDLSGNSYAGILDTTTWTFTTVAFDPTLLFADNFNRPNSSDLNAASAGKSGTLGALEWSTGTLESTIDILNNSLRINNDDSDGNDGSWAWLDHNFTGLTTFTVTMDITQQSSGGNGRFVGFRIGQSLADISGEANAAQSGNAADVQVYLDTVGGTQGIQVWEGSTSLGYVVTTANPGVLSATFTFADMNAGTTLDYEVFLDGVSQHTGSTTWSGTDENYISLQSNSTENTLIDSFEVRSDGTTLQELTLAIASSGGLLDFSWNSTGGMQYDLVSSTDPEAEPDPSLWAPYNDGTTTYEDLLVSSLTGVALTDPTRFFAILEKPVGPIESWDFEADNGGFSLIGDPNEWAWGSPDSDNDAPGEFNLVITAGNDGSDNCWATVLGTGAASGFTDTTVESILRSPTIDLTGESGAQLNFAAAIDASGMDIVEVILRNAVGDAELATFTPFALPVTADWSDYGPFDLAAGLGNTVYLEFRYAAGEIGYIGLYLDDVTITPTAP